MGEMDAALDRYQEVETGEPFTLQGPRLLKVELAETSVMARNGSMVAYQGEVHFEHKGGGLGRLLKKAATGEQLRLMQASGTGEVFLANQAMLVHLLRLTDDSLTVSGANILAFETGIEWDALISDGEPVRLDVSEAPTFGDPQAAIAWSGGVQTSLKTDVQAKSLIGLGSGESLQLGFSGRGWGLIEPSQGRVRTRN